MTPKERQTLFHQRHPERRKEYQEKYRKRIRKPCRNCNGPLPYPSPGKKYCSECLSVVQKEQRFNYYLRRDV